MNGKQMNRVSAFFAIGKWYLHDTLKCKLTWTLRATSLSVILITVKRYLHNNSPTDLLIYLLTQWDGNFTKNEIKKGFSEYISAVSEEFAVFRLIVSILLNSYLEIH